MNRFRTKLTVLAAAVVFHLPLAASAAPDKVVAIIEGKALTEQAVNVFAKTVLGRVPANDKERRQVIEELVGQELLAASAIEDGLDKDPELKIQLENLRRSLLAKRAMKKFNEEHPVSEALLKAQYQTLLARTNDNQYKARHILVETEDEAKAIIAQLDQGADFATLAKEKSTGPSGSRGGDLGWFDLKTMVPAFAEAVKGMEKGSYSKEPVKTRFGWHVILLEDVRAVTPPSFEQVRPKLQQLMQQAVVREHVAELRSKAKVEIK
jgi:peptidyl-prolyl cis-trans isomerase C